MFKRCMSKSWHFLNCRSSIKDKLLMKNVSSVGEKTPSLFIVGNASLIFSSTKNLHNFECSSPLEPEHLDGSLILLWWKRIHTAYVIFELIFNWLWQESMMQFYFQWSCCNWGISIQWTAWFQHDLEQNLTLVLLLILM